MRPFLLNILCRILFYSFGHNNFCYVDLHSMHKWVYTRKGFLSSLFRQMKPLSMPIQGLSYHWQEKCFSFCESSMDIRYFILFILTVIFSANGTSFIACWRSGYQCEQKCFLCCSSSFIMLGKFACNLAMGVSVSGGHVAKYLTAIFMRTLKDTNVHLFCLLVGVWCPKQTF